MTNMFKPSMPDTSAQEKAMERQEELLKKQEARAEEQEKEERKKAAAAMRVRKYGGMRSLLSTERENAQLGLSGVNNE